MNARDDLARDILTKTAKEDRGRLATVSLKTVPDNVAYIDWMKSVFAVSHAWIVDLRNDNVEDVASKVSSSINRSIMTSAEAETKARDRILQELMAATPEEDRGELINIAVKSASNNVAFIDWVVLVSVLSQAGIVDLDEMQEGIVDLHDKEKDYRDLIYHDDWFYDVDDDGRIIELSIGNKEDLDPLDVPAGIARLEKLTDIDVYNCRSLPVNELSRLPYLQALHLDGCSDLLENFPAQMELKYLKTLDLRISQFQSSSLFLPWMAGQLPNLERLVFRDMQKKETNFILDALRNLDVCFQNSLKHFGMARCELNDNQLETILFEIVPKFRNISTLRLVGNEIQSVQSIVDRVKSDDKTCIVSKSIRHLDLRKSPVMNKMKEDPKEKTAILSFLQTFNTVCNLGGCEVGDYDPDVEYALRINHAGRSIVEGSVDRSLPLTVWPIVLERSFGKSGHIYDYYDIKEQKNPTGLYYLLREGPALAGRVELSSDGSGRLLSSNNDDGNDDDAKEIPSKKRKTGENEGVAVALLKNCRYVRCE